MIGAKVYPTKTTSLVVPDPLDASATGTGRSQPSKATGLVSSPLRGESIAISPLPAAPAHHVPRLTTSTKRSKTSSFDLDAGARRRLLRRADRPRPRLQQHRQLLSSNAVSTRYSPPVTLQQRPVLLARARCRPRRPALRRGQPRCSGSSAAGIMGRLPQPVYPARQRRPPPARWARSRSSSGLP